MIYVLALQVLAAVAVLAIPWSRRNLLLPILLTWREMFVILPLRLVTGRRKPDYARTRLLERQLGMEPSEPCMPVPPTVAAFQRAADRYLEDGFAELARTMRSAGVSIGRVGCDALGCECLWCEEKNRWADRR